MTKTYPIIAVETHSEQDCGFTIGFDRAYHITERFPVSHSAATKATQDAYDWVPILSDITDLSEKQKVGELVVDDREYVKTRCVL